MDAFGWLQTKQARRLTSKWARFISLRLLHKKGAQGVKLGFVRAANPAAVRIDVISPELNSAGFTALILKSIPPFMCEPRTSCFIRKPHNEFKKKEKRKNPRGSPVSAFRGRAKGIVSGSSPRPLVG